MQSLNHPVSQNACDVGLLPAKRVAAFRAFLDGQNVQTRDGRGGQFFHVRTTAGWAPIQRGKRDQVATPVSLRAVVEDFLKAPIGKAILSSNSRSLFQALPEFPAGATEVQKITSLVAAAQGMSDADLAERIASNDVTTLASLQSGAREFLGIDPANGPDKCVETVLRRDEGGSLEVIDIRKPAAGDNSPTLFQERATARPEKALSASQREYLRDLRDDFALRAPLMMNEGETMAAFADRCWQYADLMIERRPTMAGD
jgi:hypothetical protein